MIKIKKKIIFIFLTISIVGCSQKIKDTLNIEIWNDSIRSAIKQNGLMNDTVNCPPFYLTETKEEITSYYLYVKILENVFEKRNYLTLLQNDSIININKIDSVLIIESYQMDKSYPFKNLEELISLKFFGADVYFNNSDEYFVISEDEHSFYHIEKRSLKEDNMPSYNFGLAEYTTVPCFSNGITVFTVINNKGGKYIYNITQVHMW